jgi:anti-sigma factor RsiW
MDCSQARNLIHAHVDGELDLVTTLEFERHIHDCSQCSRACESLAALRTAVRGGGLYYDAPQALTRRIRADVRAAGGRRSTALRFGGWRSLAIAAPLAAMLAVALWLPLRGGGGSADRLLAQEVRASHVRSLMADHLFDVESTDRHTVKPWFHGRIDFAPDVRNFESDGFALVGGRIDYLADRPVAALVYRHDKHVVNLFLWPAPTEPDCAPTELSQQGYAMIHWIHSGMTAWAIADTAPETLRRFADLVRGTIAPASSP